MIEPLGDRLLVKKVAEETQTTKGILMLPSSSSKPFEKAVVIGAGRGPQNQEGQFLTMPVIKGDVIYLRTHCGIPISQDGEEYHIIKLDDVIARDC